MSHDGDEPVEQREYTISEAAGLIGFSPAALRAWEQQGLIAPRRSPGGYRLFDAEDLERLIKIAHLRRNENLNPAAIKRLLGAPSKDGSSSVWHETQQVGPVIRRLRRLRGLTLREVGRQTGLSASFLSQVERSLAGISAASLRRLLEFYGTTLAELTRHRISDVRHLTRAHTRTADTGHISGVAIEHLAAGSAQMDPTIFVIQPGASSEGFYTHEGEEFVYVLEGQLEVTLVGEPRYLLEAGDSFYYPSTIEHAWRNPGDDVARVLWVNTPPSF